MFFTPKEIKTLETYAQLKEILVALIHSECPEHRIQHHILYSANLKLHQLEQAKQHFSTLIDLSTPIGQYAKVIYDEANQKYNELHCIIRAYSLFCDQKEQARLNHNLHFSKHKVADCYTLLMTRHQYKHILPIEPTFWQAIKQQILPIVAELE